MWLLCHLNGPCFALESLQEEGPVLVSPQDEVVSYSYPQKVVSGTLSCISHFIFVVALWSSDHSAWTCVHLWGPLTASGSREYNSLQITSKTEDALQVSATLNWYFQANFQRVWIVSAFTARIYKMRLREVRIFEVCGIFIVCVKASCRGRLLNVLDSFPDVGELCNSFYLHRCLYCSSHRSLFKFCCLHSSQCHNSSSPTNSSSACHSISLFCGEAR